MRYPWSDRAACKGNSTLFFAGSGTLNERAAIAICNECPCVEPCRETALEAEEEEGVWGGMGERERRREIGRRRLQHLQGASA